MSGELFRAKVDKWFTDKKSASSRFLSDADYHLIIEKLQSFSKKESKPSTSREYRWVSTLSVLEYGDGSTKLVRNPDRREVLPVSRLFDAIHEAHTLTGHGGRDKMTAFLKKDYWNVTSSSKCTWKPAGNARRNGLVRRSIWWCHRSFLINLTRVLRWI